MNNDLIEQKSWWKKHWKWFVPLISMLLILVCVFFISGSNSIVGDYSKAYADQQLYSDALEKVRENERIKDVLGTIEPMRNTAILNGSVKYFNDNTSVKTTIKIFCTKGKAMLDIAANRIDNTWHYQEIRVRIKNPPEKREIIEIFSLVE